MAIMCEKPLFLREEKMNTEKKIAAFLFIAFIGMNLFGQENNFSFKPLFGGGGATAVFDGTGGYGLGGIGEFALLFYDNGLQVSNHFVGRGDSVTAVSGNHYGAGSIMEKISFGGFLPKDFLRSYAFVEGGIGFGGGNGTTTLNLIFGGGGGIDLFYYNSGSIYLEVGYLQHYLNDEIIGGLSISIGSRGWH
jgi:hypothetical protein